MSPELKINPRLAQNTVQLLGRMLSGFGILQGFFIIISDEGRWSGPSFELALTVPGAPPVWGVLLLGAGLVSLVGSLASRMTPVVVGMYAGALWSSIFAVTFGITAIQNQSASTTGVWAYSLIGVLYVLVATVYRNSRGMYRDALHRYHS